ncbi:nuclear transport factor 2 family protein [Streptomyces sp. CAU 1734]|uniref:nuclear transport factor 2 family protein n=1 Tax=Streptomyces sp. CAU 1734 TaxID=3140360 RepID=UPI0032606AE9
MSAISAARAMGAIWSGTGAGVPAGVYAQVQQFYTWQMGLLEGDEADPEAWAATFTEDAVFASTVQPEPERGRAAILASVRAGVAGIAAQRLDFRHWFGMVGVEEGDEEGSLRTRYYALAMATPRGGSLKVRGSLLCYDDLVRGESGGLLVARRTLVADGRSG